MIRCLLILLFTLPGLGLAKCMEYKKIHGLIHLQNKSWETTHVNKNNHKSCEKLPLPPAPNLEVTFMKGKKTFSTKIFRSLVGFYDYSKDKKNLEGGKFELKYLPIETFAPTWFKDSKLSIKEIETNQIIIETKL